MSITKNLIKLFVVMFVTTLLLSSCDLFKKGGTIEVTNGTGYPTLVIVVKGEKFLEALKELQAGKGTTIPKGGKKTFDYDKDGIYTVCALMGDPSTVLNEFHEVITLIGGGTQKVTIKKQ